MSDLFVGGRVVDWILGLVLAEALLVLGWRCATGRGPAPVNFVANLFAGAFLLLALRNALAGASEAWIALCLLAGLAAHLVDLALRWNDGASRFREARTSRLLRVPDLGRARSRVTAPGAQNGESSNA